MNNSWISSSKKKSKDYHFPFLPPPSTPRATGHSPAHTTAADPLEEPPVILLVSCGFRVGLKIQICTVSHIHNPIIRDTEKQFSYP